MVTTSHQHIQACMEAWLNCENLLVAADKEQRSLSHRTAQVLDECASICLGTLEAMKKQCKNIEELALLCVGICEECAEVCDRYKQTAFQVCAATCRQCARLFTPIAAAAM